MCKIKSLYFASDILKLTKAMALDVFFPQNYITES